MATFTAANTKQVVAKFTICGDTIAAKTKLSVDKSILLVETIIAAKAILIVTAV